MADYNPYRPLLPPNEAQAFHRLFNVESQFMSAIDEGTSPQKRERSNYSDIRQVAVPSIEKLSKSDENFDAFIPYLAMNYFDRFASNHTLPVVLSDRKEDLDLFVLCCLTIAWKMRDKSFSVVQFQTKRGLHFDSKRLMQMELHILTTLGWRVRSLTPICFAQFFISFLSLSRANFNPKPVLQIIITTSADMEFTQFRPSIVAASALLTALSNAFPARIEEFEERIESCPYVNQMELVMCMMEMEKRHKKKEEAGGIGGGSGGGGPEREHSTSQLPISFPATGGGTDSQRALLDAAMPPTGPPREQRSGKAAESEIELSEFGKKPEEKDRGRRPGKDPVVKQDDIGKEPGVEDRGQRPGKEKMVEEDRGRRPGKEKMVEEDRGRRPGKEKIVEEDRGRRPGKEIMVEEDVEEKEEIIKLEIKEDELMLEEDWMGLELNWTTDGQAAAGGDIPTDSSDPPPDAKCHCCNPQDHCHCCTPEHIHCASCDIL